MGIARLFTQEQGKPLKNARTEILSSADVLDYYAEEGKRNFGEWITSQHSRSIVASPTYRRCCTHNSLELSCGPIGLEGRTLSCRRLYFCCQTTKQGSASRHRVREGGV